VNGFFFPTQNKRGAYNAAKFLILENEFKKKIQLSKSRLFFILES